MAESIDGAPPPVLIDRPPELSIVAPFYNESANLDTFFTRVRAVMQKLNLSYEIVCVNDGSRDDTLERLVQHHQKDPAIKVVNLSRNFGKDIALTAAIDHARGNAVVPIDSDLQDPPEVIGELVAKWREGYDVVYATRRTRQGEGVFKRVTADLFYRIFDATTDFAIPRNTGDFRLMSRAAVDALKRLPERNRFMKGLFAWVGFRQTAVFYDRQPRHAGTTKWNYWRLWNFAIDGITGFSSLPLRIWSYIGLFLATCAFVYAVFLVVLKLGWGIETPGYASIMVAVLLLGGVQLITLGVLGEYISRIYIEVKARPLYLVRDTYGIKPIAAPAVTAAAIVPAEKSEALS
ncbi:MAG TPA: glycosyltransferase family 2 protein [Planctomycetota bacterium]|nr:glycosyltransferase family 2 protein [Planctomycetota bacterium]